MLNLTPILNKEEQTKVNEYQTNPWEKLYKEKQEDYLYSTVKAVRKSDQMPKLKFKPDNEESYKEMVITKPKEFSPFGSVNSFSLGDAAKTVYQGFFKKLLGEETGELLVEQQKEIALAGLEVTKEVTAPVARGIAAVLDKPQEVIIHKPIAATATLASIATRNTQELISSFEENRPFDFLAAGERVEDDQKAIEYFFGTEVDNFGSYLDTRSLQERREQMLTEETPQQQEALRGLDNYTLGLDVVAGLGVGIGGYKAVGKLALRPGLVGNVGKTLLKGGDVMQKGLVGAGSLFAAQSSLYYGATGKWIFEGDRQATEGAIIGMFSKVIDLGTIGAKNLYPEVKKLMHSPEFKKGVNEFNENMKATLAEGTDDLADRLRVRSKFLPEGPKQTRLDLDVIKPKKPLTKTEAKLARNKIMIINELQQQKRDLGIKDSKLYAPKANEIKDARADGLLKLTGKTDEGLLKFEWTDKARSIRGVEASGVGVHFPEDLYVKWTGDDVSALIKPNIIDEIKGVADEATQARRVDDIYQGLGDVQRQPKTFTDKIKNSGKWDDTKGEFVNKWNYMTDSVIGRAADTTDKKAGVLLGIDKGIDKYLSKAERGASDVLSSVRHSNKFENVANQFQTLVNEIGDDLTDFNKSWFAKSRLNKTISKPGLKTRTTINGKHTVLTLEDLEGLANKDGGKFDATIQEFQDINRRVLDYEEGLGIIGVGKAEELSDFNKFYAPDRLIDDDAKRLQGAFQRGEKNAPRVTLREGSETLDFNINSVENTFKNLKYRLEFAKKVEYLKEFEKIQELTPGANKIITRVSAKQPLKQGYSRVASFDNGEAIYYSVPKFVADNLNESPVMLGNLTKLLSTPTQIVKTWATGKFAPIFQLTSPSWEIPSAMIHNFTAGKSNVDFIKNLFASSKLGLKTGSFIDTAQGKTALYGLMNETGGGFTRQAHNKQELLNVFTDQDKVFLSQKNALVKGRDKLIDITDFGHKVEQITTRAPLFETALKGQGVSKDKFLKLTAEADGNFMKLKRLLEKEGYNPNLAAAHSRNLFNYAAATKKMQAISNFIPYLSTGVGAASQIKRIFEASPRKFLAGVLPAYLAFSELNYEYNAGIGAFEDQTKAELWAGRPDYQKYTPLQYSGVESKNGKESAGFIGKNMPGLDMVYSSYVEMRESMEGNKDFETKKAINKAVENYSLVFSLENLLQTERMPTLLKNLGEISLNQDFFTKRPLVKDSIEGQETLDYTAKTPSSVVVASRVIALATGGEQQPDGSVKGGAQFSPIKLQKFFSNVDPKGIIAKELSFITDDMENTGTIDQKHTTDFLNVFKKYVTFSNGTNVLYDIKEQVKNENDAINRQIYNRIKSAGDDKELAKEIGDLLLIYPEKEDYIIEKGEYRIIETMPEGGPAKALKGKLSSKEYGAYLYEVIYKNKGDKGVAKEVATLIKDKTFTQKKINEIFEIFIKHQMQ